jgi:hypothetical protein
VRLEFDLGAKKSVSPSAPKPPKPRPPTVEDYKCHNEFVSKECLKGFYIEISSFIKNIVITYDMIRLRVLSRYTHCQRFDWQQEDQRLKWYPN